MTYMLRDRPDGFVEIVLSTPILVGIFPERDVAQKVCVFLQHEVEMPEDQPSSFATAAADVEAAELEALAELGPRDESQAGPVELPAMVPTAPSVRKPVRNLPAVVEERPRPPVFQKPVAPSLTDEQRDLAFRRIADGHKVGAVAAEFGVPMAVMRGLWANHIRHFQAHIAEAGQQRCRMCAKPFTPSISHPETCARCSHE